MSRPDEPSDRARLESLSMGYRGTALLYALVKSGLADALAAGPLSVAELAAARGLHAPSVRRVLRGLAVVGAVRLLGEDRCELTSMGRLLVRPSAAADHLVVTVESHQPAWSGLTHSLRDGRTAFDAVFGMSNWEHRRRTPSLSQAFNGWMAGLTQGSAGPIAQAVDVPAGGLVADVGGGEGVLLAAILARQPAARGLLLDQPALAEPAARLLAEAGLADRARFVAGDFFRPLGFQADVVVLKSVLHDWDDDACVALLGHCREALLPGGRLLVAERLLPDETPLDPHVTLLDVQMLAVTGGRERALPEYRALLARAGLELSQVRATPVGFSVIEARRA